jgi:crotonobetainyl-CoA:carnitine CoA-transferase CaiB-like acyl-CoA transferase
MEKPLEGIKVLELASVLAGPSVGMFFSELGAEVIKVENAPAGGDVTRKWKVEGEDPGSHVSAYFASINYRKNYLFKDLKNPEHLKEVFQLAQNSDVLISNFKTGDAEKFGVEYARIKSINPRIVYGHLRGFDSDVHRAGYDVIAQAETGYMSMNGTPESGPLKFPVAIIDILAAQQLKEGIMVGLWRRERTGKGCYIETSLEAAGLASLVNQASAYLMYDKVPLPTGSMHPGICPYGDTFICRDGKAIVLAVGTDKQFAKLSRLLGEPELFEDLRFSTNPSRVVNRVALSEKLARLFLYQERDTIMRQLIAEDVPAGAIRDLSEVFAGDFAKSMILEETIEGVPTKRVRTVAFRMED